MGKTLSRIAAYELLVTCEAYKAMRDDLKHAFSSVIRGVFTAGVAFAVLGTAFTVDRVFGVIVPLVIVLIYFLWKLLTIPSQLYVAQKKQKKNYVIAADLAEEFRKGCSILREDVTNAHEQMNFINAYDEWSLRVLEKLKTIGDDQAFMFDSIGFSETALSIQHAFEPEKSLMHLRNNLAARLEKLRLITGRTFGNAEESLSRD